MGNRPSRRGRQSSIRPAAAFRQRSPEPQQSVDGFNAPELWIEPEGRESIDFRTQAAGRGFVHPVTTEEVAERISRLSQRFLENVEVIQLSGMTRKRSLFPCYGMQWGTAVYLYPIEESLVEVYVRPPRPEQMIEARMYGGRWEQEGRQWRLVWTEKTIRDFYLNNVLIHEIGHAVDDRNTSFMDRERFANWFAIEHGYRASRGKRSSARRA